MTNAEQWKPYVEYTQSFSDNARKLGYVAAAIAWAFKSSTGKFPPEVEGAWVCIIGFFVFDLLLPFVAAIVLRTWLRRQETRLHEATGTIEGKYEKPAWLDVPAYCCLWLKAILLLGAFIFLAAHLLL